MSLMIESSNSKEFEDSSSENKNARRGINTSSLSISELKNNSDINSLSSSDLDNYNRIPEKISNEDKFQNEKSILDNGNQLSRNPTSYSVKDIYGEMKEENIQLKRTATKNTILTALSNRVYGTSNSDLEKTGDKISSSSELNEIPIPSKNFGVEFSSLDPELVTWDGTDDPEYPRNWSKKTKILHTAIVSFYTLISPMSSSVLSPAMDDIAISLNINSTFLESFSVSIMVLAWAIGPLLIAPLSEDARIGRLPVLNISIWINCAFLLGCGFAKTTVQLCVFRFLGGLGGCAALNVGAGTLSDLWSDIERQFAMALYSLCPTLGPIISPIISSWIAQYASWRWCFWVLCIFNGIIALFGTTFFVETYSPKLLRDKAKFLRKETGNESLHTIYEIADGETQMEKIIVATTRPIKLLFTHPMVIGLGAFMAFTYGFLYLMIVTFPTVWRDQYGFSVGVSGLMFIPMGIAYIIGTAFWSPVINRIYIKMIDKNNGIAKPEFRLPCLCASGIGLPIGLIWYGWSAEKELHWIMPAIGSAIFAFFFIAVFLTIQNYLIDMNNRFAASSIAAAAVFRSIFGFTFPLFADPMYSVLGYGWGNTLFGLIGILLGIPFPIFCLLYGERLREWANRRIVVDQTKRDARNLERLKSFQQQRAC